LKIRWRENVHAHLLRAERRSRAVSENHGLKAPEGWRTRGRCARFASPAVRASVLDCGGPPPLCQRRHPSNGQKLTFETALAGEGSFFA